MSGPVSAEFALAVLRASNMPLAVQSWFVERLPGADKTRQRNALILDYASVFYPAESVRRQARHIRADMLRPSGTQRDGTKLAALTLLLRLNDGEPLSEGYLRALLVLRKVA